MTNANMKLVILNVVLDDEMEIPAAKLEVGEFIVKKVVELAKLKAELEGKPFFGQINRYTPTHRYPADYDRKVWTGIVYPSIYSLSARDSWWTLGSLTLHPAMTWPTN